MFKCAEFSNNALESSYLVPKIIAKDKRPLTIAEQVIVAACTAIFNKMTKPQAAKEIAKVPLSNSWLSGKFSLQVDYSTDVSDLVQGGLSW